MSVKVKDGKLILQVGPTGKQSEVIDIEEVAYIAAKETLDRCSMCLYGRKITHYLDQANDNVLPSELGFERHKYSRLFSKKVISLSLKNLIVP
jgi:hypothetical protein